MSATPTAQFIQTLQSLKAGDLGLLRVHAGLSLDSSVDGFDLFAGLWWPLRERSQKTPRREVAWLIAKLFAFCPIPQFEGATLARQLGGLRPSQEARQKRFDALLSQSLSLIEPSLQWALALIAKDSRKLDWVCLTDDLSIWERARTRLKWAEEYLQQTK